MINPKEENDLIKSQDLLRSIMSEAIGIYMAKEPAEKDNWRRVSVWQLLQHAKHEFEEIERSDTKDRYYHNCLDLLCLVAMLASRGRDPIITKGDNNNEEK